MNTDNQLDLSIIVLSENLKDLDLAQTISLQELVKQDVNKYLDKSIAKGREFSVHEIEKLVLKSFDRHLKCKLVASTEIEAMDNAKHEVNYIDFFDYRVNTMMDILKKVGIHTNNEENKKIEQKPTAPSTMKKSNKVLKLKQKNSEPKNCKINNIKKFIQEGTIYEINKERFRPTTMISNTLNHSRNVQLPLTQRPGSMESKRSPTKEKTLPKFVYYGK